MNAGNINKIKLDRRLRKQSNRKTSGTPRYTHVYRSSARNDDNGNRPWPRFPRSYRARDPSTPKRQYSRVIRVSKRFTRYNGVRARQPVHHQLDQSDVGARLQISHGFPQYGDEDAPYLGLKMKQ